MKLARIFEIDPMAPIKASWIFKTVERMNIVVIVPENFKRIKRENNF